MVRDGIKSNKSHSWGSRRLKALIDPMKLDSYYAKNNKTKRQRSNIKSTEQKFFIRESKKRKTDNNGKAKAMNNYSGGDPNEIIIGCSISSSSKSDEVENIKEHKKMKFDNNLKSVTKHTRSRSIFDCNDILLEVLSRLPVKSLMLCKCVSKHWKFTISQDEDFIDLHFARSKQPCSDLFVVVPRHTQDDMIKKATHNSGFKSRGAREYRYQRSILLGNLFETINKTVRRLEHSPFYYTEILKPLNGLICFVNRRQAGVCILNPTTRESTGWISSSLRTDKSYESYDFVKENERGLWVPTYFFGFDPATKRHKVLCTWSTLNNPREKLCEVLTVGEKNWRRIKTGMMSFHGRVKVSVYADGFIYWGITPLSVPQFLNAFDVGSEKFKLIKLPREVREKCMNPPERQHYDFVNSLIEFGGHVALLQRWSSNVAKLWICRDNACVSSYPNWTEMTLELPFQWVLGSSVFLHGVAGANRIIIESNPCRSDIKEVSLWSYDCEKKTSTGIVKSGVVSKLVSDSLYSKLESVSLFTPFVESLWPVRKHGFRRNHHVNNVQNKKDEHLSEPVQVINEYLNSYFGIKKQSNISNTAEGSKE